MAPSPLRVGNVVLLRNGLGLGRVARVDESEVAVEYFESTAEPIALEIMAAPASVRRVELGVQTRVFFRDEDSTWRAGRVVGGGPDAYAVRLPNVEFDRSVHESRLRVRWERPPKDPLPVLTSGGNESPHFLNSRAPVRALLLADRASCAGMTGVSSAAVAIHGHQVHAAFKVLRDPVKRYLLADEVGLGKTIEAGFIARQLLIDDPTRMVGVLAPQALCRQWEQEMRLKFLLEDFPGPAGESVLRIAAHEQPRDWAQLSSVGLLIVDEAHLLANPAVANGATYSALATLCHNIGMLLLLSATPFTQHYRTHLGLLHLLDPALFRWEDEEQFKVLLKHRRDLAMAVFGLDLDPDPDNVELVEFQFERIRGLLPDDPVLAQLMNEALEGLNQGQRDAIGLGLLRRKMLDIRTHISETYRLHHRVIRNRRHTVEQEELDDAGLLTPFQFTGRQRPTLARVASDADVQASRFLHTWYRRVSDDVVNRGLDAAPYGSLLALLVSRLGATSADLREVMRFRLTGSFGESSRLNAGEQVTVSDAPVLDFEHRLFDEWQSIDEAESLEEVAKAILGRIPHARRVVVFCGAGALAGAIAGALKSVAPGYSILPHTIDSGEAAREVSMSTWGARGGVLVVDDSGDVGRNFQTADVAIHLRLPCDAGLFEQRIGRVDRYGEHAGAKQIVFGEPDRDGLHSAWLKMLADGFSIFDRSISAVQESAQQLSADLWREVVVAGIEALTEGTVRVAAELSTELRRVNELDALEATFEQDDHGRAIAERISHFDGQADLVQRAFNDLLTGVSGFRFKARTLIDGSVTYSSDPEADPLLSPRLLRRVAVPEAVRTGVFDRWRTPPGRRLLRRGNPFIDGIASVMELDDRGQAAALWRLDPRWEEEPIIYFGFDFVVQADPKPLMEHLGESSDAGLVAIRRGDMALPPFARRIWVRVGSQTCVTDALELRFLNVPYKAVKSDVNLAHKRMGALYGAAGGRDVFSHSAVAGRDLALSELARTSDMKSLTVSAADAVRRDTGRLVAQARTRKQSRDLLFDDSALDLEVALGEALERGVLNPDIKTSSAICLVRAAQSWTRYA